MFVRDEDDKCESYLRLNVRKILASSLSFLCIEYECFERREQFKWAKKNWKVETSLDSINDDDDHHRSNDLK